MSDRSIIRCRQCRARLVGHDGEYRCSICAARYPVHDGILIMDTAAVPQFRPEAEIGFVDYHELRRNPPAAPTHIPSAVDYHLAAHGFDFMAYHAELLAPYLRGATIADLGCGQLPYLAAFSGSGVAAYVGLDLDPRALAVARRNCQAGFPLTLVQHDVVDTPLADGSADLVISSEVLEHLAAPHAYLRELWRICKPGGMLSLSMPSVAVHLYPYNFLKLLAKPWFIPAWWKRLHADRYWAEALAWHPGLRPRILREWVTAAGFTVLRHESKLWYYNTPLRPGWRLFSLLERAGMRSAGAAYKRHLLRLDRCIPARVPVLKWLGIRQFILAGKPPAEPGLHHPHA